MKFEHWLNIFCLLVIVLCVWFSGLVGCATRGPMVGRCGDKCSGLEPSDTDICLMRCIRAEAGHGNR